MAALQPIPFFSNPRLNTSPDVKAAVERVVESGIYLNGPQASAFENEFAHYIGARHCIATGNGSDALELALRAAGIQAGDGVATVANAGFYGSTAIRLIGAKPLYVDIDLPSMTMSAQALARALEHQPRAVIVTHLYGRMADIATLKTLCDAANVALIEDCAQAHGAMVAGRKAGHWGAIGCFSFYPTKNLGALGDAGALVTSDTDMAQRLQALHQYGWSAKYTVTLQNGRNSRMDEMQAAILRVKLNQLDSDNHQRRLIAMKYNELLADTPLALPAIGGADHVSHLYVVRTSQRDALHSHLQKRGIHCQIHYPVADHQQPAYLGQPPACASLPETERACAQVLSLPCYPGLTMPSVERIALEIRQFFERKAA